MAEADPSNPDTTPSSKLLATFILAELIYLETLERSGEHQAERYWDEFSEWIGEEEGLENEEIIAGIHEARNEISEFDLELKRMGVT